MQRFSMEIRVTYKDTDQMGYVYYGNFFTWFEMARTEYFRSRGVIYKNLEAEGYYLPVHEARCEYHVPVRYDDIVKVKTFITKIGRTSLTFGYQITKDDSASSLATGLTIHCFTNKAGRPVKIPEIIRKIIHVDPSTRSLHLPKVSRSGFRPNIGGGSS